MIALLVWVGGCALGIWAIFRMGYEREAIGSLMSMAVVFWIVGGAAWVERKIGKGSALRTAGSPRGVAPGAVQLTDKERDAMKRIASEQKSAEHQP